jgi:hypothetical protein
VCVCVCVCVCSDHGIKVIIYLLDFVSKTLQEWMHIGGSDFISLRIEVHVLGRILE